MGIRKLKALREIEFGSKGLVPAIVQEFRTGRVLMLAYMNREAVARTLKSGYAHFYSRSRRKIWKKGEESGHVQEVKEMRLDCDGDAVLLRVRQRGPGACHTGYASCFYRRLKRGVWLAAERMKFDPRRKYGKK